MNTVAVARFLGNLAIAVGFVVVLFVVVPMFPGVSGWTWALVLFSIATVGGLAQLVAALAPPKEVMAAFDEQVKASDRASYVFGYWCVMAVFLLFLALVLTDRMDPTRAFLMMGLPLAIAPSLYMVVAFLRGRAR